MVAILDHMSALADPTRLAILHALETRERNVTDLLGGKIEGKARLKALEKRLQQAEKKAVLSAESKCQGRRVGATARGAGRRHDVRCGRVGRAKYIR